MRPDDLVRMANQIAVFFAPYPEPDAVAGIRDHIEKFWDPAMRRELLTLDAAPREPAVAGAAAPTHATLDPLAVRAIAQLRLAAAATGSAERQRL